MKIKQTPNYKLTLFYKGQAAEIPLHVGSFYIGNNEKCLVQLDFEDPSEIYQFEIAENFFNLKSLNPIHKISVDGNSYTEIKTESNCEVSFSGVKISAEFLVSSQKKVISGQNITLNSEVLDQLPPIPPIPVVVKPQAVQAPKEEILKSPVENSVLESEVTSKFININGDVEEIRFNKLVAIDNIYCDIRFEDAQSMLINDPDEFNLNIDQDAYIDFEDKELEIPSVRKDESNKSVEISWLHNGILLSQQYFPVSIDKIFISKDKEARKIFKASSMDIQGKFALVEKDSQTDKGIFLVNVLPGASVSIWESKKQRQYIEGEKIHLSDEQAIILTQGLNQIILRLSFVQAPLEKSKFFIFDEQLIKYLASGFAAILIPFFLILLITKIPDRSIQKKEEVVVIYKKKLADATEKVTSNTQTSEQAQQPKAVTEADQLAKPDQPMKAEVPKKQPIQKNTNKLATAQKNQTTTPTKSVSQTKAVENAQTKPVTKAYSFSASSQFKSLLGTSSNTVAKEVDNKRSFVAEGATGATLSKSTTVGEIGKVNSAAKGFEGAEVGGVDTNYGTSGLSGKSGVDTAYMESQTKVLGAIDPNLIRKILREYIPQFRYCYHQELRKDSSVAGVFDLEFKIDSNGKGKDVNIVTKDKDFSATGVQCIQNVVALIQFPKVKGGGFVEVVQPLNFQSTKK